MNKNKYCLCDNLSFKKVDYNIRGRIYSFCVHPVINWHPNNICPKCKKIEL